MIELKGVNLNFQWLLVWSNSIPSMNGSSIYMLFLVEDNVFSTSIEIKGD